MNMTAVINACKQQCSFRGPNNFLFPNHIRKKIFHLLKKKKDTAEDISKLIKIKSNRHKTKKLPNSNCLYQVD